jgi:hypothetical protein
MPFKGFCLLGHSTRECVKSKPGYPIFSTMSRSPARARSVRQFAAVLVSGSERKSHRSEAGLFEVELGAFGIGKGEDETQSVTV